MAESSSIKAIESAAKRRIHGAALGYQPHRMKPVHFATGFIQALTGRQFKLELLNQAAVPKASPKDADRPDAYLVDAVGAAMSDAGALLPAVDTASLRLLRSHLNAVLNNDGGVFPFFKPYSSQSNDYTAPSAEYVSAQSKNHGHSGLFVIRALIATPDGREFLDHARKIVAECAPPQADFGRPLLDLEAIEWEDKYEELFGPVDDSRFAAASDLMHRQTAALVKLARNLLTRRPIYAVRYLVLGVCSWLYLYMMRRWGNDPLLLIDACQGRSRRIRAQSCASYARQINIWSGSYDAWYAQESDKQAFRWDLFDTDDKARREIDEHYRDFGVRIGFVQPRASQARQKHFELLPDTLRVLAFSILENGEVLTFPDFADRLRDLWGLCTGGGGNDGDLLFAAGFTPLDEDDDLRLNAEGFRSLLVGLGLAVEPSDGLVLCAIDAAELI